MCFYREITNNVSCEVDYFPITLHPALNYSSYNQQVICQLEIFTELNNDA